MAVEDEFIQVGGLLGGEPVQPQVIEDEQVWRQEGPEDAVHRVVHPGLGHGFEEVISVAEAHGVSGADSGIAESLSEEALPHAGWSHQQHVLVLVQKLGREYGVQQTAVQGN